GLTWSPETLTVNGNYTQNSGATLQLNLFDPSHRDALHISSQANFGGILDVSFAVGAPAPHLGDIFDILDFASASGAFATLNLPALPTDLAWDTTNLLTNGVLKIGMSGDFNGDGTVDAADYVVWRQGLGTLYTQADYDVWRAHFGQTAGSGSGAIANAAVPEPITSLRMLIVAMLAMSSNRRRKVSEPVCK
ncbi:MAG: hypothetical protein ACJ8LM_15560, partial [Candidatus Udaeobacter sp.]